MEKVSWLIKILSWLCIGQVRSVIGCLIGGLLFLIPAFFLGVMVGVQIGAPQGAILGQSLFGKVGGRIGYWLGPLIIFSLIIIVFEVAGITIGNFLGGTVIKFLGQNRQNRDSDR